MQVIDRLLIFNAGASAVARVRPTIPIACKFEESCGIVLKATIPVEDIHGHCSGLALYGRQCGISLRSENPQNTIYEIEVISAENGQYQTENRYYEIFLETNAPQDNEIWLNYALPKIHVSSVHIKFKHCTIRHVCVCMCVCEKSYAKIDDKTSMLD